MIKFCEDIGLFTVNRPRTSCVHATHFCRRKCYHAKFEKLYERHRAALEQREEDFWRELNEEEFSRILKTKRKPTKRFRFMSRGEALKEPSDVVKVARICKVCKDTVFMLPTRAWRDAEMFACMRHYFRGIPNLRVLFSTDPDCYDQCMVLLNTYEEAQLVRNAHVTFFGDDRKEFEHPKFRCPKTWFKDHKVTCANCKLGCFAKPQLGAARIIHFKTH